MSNIVKQINLELTSSSLFINTFLDELLNQYCSKHYEENTVIGEGIKLPTLNDLILFNYPNYYIISVGLIGNLASSDTKVIYDKEYHENLVKALEHKLNRLFIYYIPKNIYKINFEILVTGSYSCGINSLILSRYIESYNLFDLDSLKDYFKEYNFDLEYLNQNNFICTIHNSTNKDGIKKCYAGRTKSKGFIPWLICSNHYQDNIENVISKLEEIYSKYLLDGSLPNIV